MKVPNRLGHSSWDSKPILRQLQPVTRLIKSVVCMHGSWQLIRSKDLNLKDVKLS